MMTSIYDMFYGLYCITTFRFCAPAAGGEPFPISPRLIISYMLYSITL